MTAQPLPRSDSVCEAVRTAPDRARRALTERHDGALTAVAWMSAHLAASERTLLPHVRARLNDDEGITRLRRLGAHAYIVLRRLEQLHSGDAHVRALDGAGLRRAALGAIEAYAAAEHGLVCRLTDVLEPHEQATLVAAYERALAAAPTRPHPHTPHAGFLGALAFRIDAARDRILDTLDSRPVPIPRQRRSPGKPGRWTLYALGETDRPSE